MIPQIQFSDRPLMTLKRITIADLRYVEPLPGFLERSIFASGELKPWLRSGRPCGLDQPVAPQHREGWRTRQPRRGFHALREGFSPHERSHARRRTMSDVFSYRPTCMFGRRAGSAIVTAVVRGGSTSMRTAINAQSSSTPQTETRSLLTERGQKGDNASRRSGDVQRATSGR